MRVKALKKQKKGPTDRLDVHALSICHRNQFITDSENLSHAGLSFRTSHSAAQTDDPADAGPEKQLESVS